MKIEAFILTKDRHQLSFIIAVKFERYRYENSLAGLHNREKPSLEQALCIL